MLVSLGTLFMVSALGAAQSSPNGYYYLEAGGYVAGQVVTDDGTNVSIRLRDENEVKQFAYADFTARTQYKLRSQTVSAEDGSAQIRLADFSLELGLHREATRHYRAAARLDRELWEVATDGLRRVDAEKAEVRLDAASRLLESGQFGEAQDLLVALSDHPDTSVADRAVALMDTFPDITRSKPYFVEEAFPTFARVRKYYERAQERNRDGLLHTRSSSRAERDFRAAKKDVMRALRLLARMRDKEGHDGLFERAALDMERDLLDLQAATALNQASLHMVQQSFRQALTVLNEALAYDQTNALLLEARNRVEDAVSHASGVVLSSL